jgi:hypothetical protein
MDHTCVICKDELLIFLKLLESERQEDAGERHEIPVSEETWNGLPLVIPSLKDTEEGKVGTQAKAA